MSSTAYLTNAPKESDTQGHQSVAEPALQNQVNEPEAGMLSRVFSGSPGEPHAKNASQLLRSPALSHPANNSLRAVVLQRAQQTHGNHYAQRLITGDRHNVNEVIPPENPGHSLAEGAPSSMEARLKPDFDGIRVHNGKKATGGRDIYFAAGQYAPSIPLSHQAERLQAKLVIGRPGDLLEQEADLAADQVTGMPEAMAKAKPG